MSILEECKNAVQVLTQLGYDEYKPLLQHIQWAIAREKMDREEDWEHLETMPLGDEDNL